MMRFFFEPETTATIANPDASMAGFIISYEMPLSKSSGALMIWRFSTGWPTPRLKASIAQEAASV